MSEKDKFWIAFSAIEQADSKFVQRLYNYFGDIEIAFTSSLNDLSNIEGLNVKKAETFLRERDKIDVEKCFQEVIKRDLKYLTFEDENYPYMLKQICDPPMVLYVKGDLKGCNLEKTLAVVGSRKASSSAKDVLNKIITELNNTDICIVSGLASGIDTTAHQSALANGLKTIGVIASGFDYTYPAANKDLYKKIADGNGAILSEFYPTKEPLQFRFPQRNRIVTGISYGTLVAEAAIKSGALISANFCLEQGRELMCIPGLVTNPNTKGIYKLLKQGATMVTEAEDILQALNWEIKPPEQLKISMEVSADEQKILEVIEIEPKGFDTILAQTKINPENVLVCLTNMELLGIIKQVEGEKYKKL